MITGSLCRSYARRGQGVAQLADATARSGRRFAIARAHGVEVLRPGAHPQRPEDLWESGGGAAQQYGRVALAEPAGEVGGELDAGA
jgi:hypothetical protein